MIVCFCNEDVKTHDILRSAWMRRIQRVNKYMQNNIMQTGMTAICAVFWLINHKHCYVKYKPQDTIYSIRIFHIVGSGHGKL